MELDGYDEPIFIRAEMIVSGSEIVIDYRGTSRASAYGVNSPLCYTEAYTCFGLKCIVAPSVPNNHGSLEVFRTVAEPGSAVHPVHPSPVTARHVIGQMLPDVALGCLAQALPGEIPGGERGEHLGASLLQWRRGSRRRAGQQLGAVQRDECRYGGDWRAPRKGRALRYRLSERDWRHSGGGHGIRVASHLLAQGIPARLRGGRAPFEAGLGQVIEVGSTEDHPFTVSAATFDRIRNPPRGRDGGLPGRSGAAGLVSGPSLPDKGVHTIPAGDRLVVKLPGGGGLGDPLRRDRARLREDLEGGYITREGALGDFGYEEGSSGPGKES